MEMNKVDAVDYDVIQMDDNQNHKGKVNGGFIDDHVIDAFETGNDIPDTKESQIIPEDDLGCCMTQVSRVQSSIGGFWSKHKTHIKYIFMILFVVGYFVYFGFALAYEFGDEGSIRLLWVTCVVVLGIIISWVRDHFGDKIEKIMEPVLKFTRKYSLAINLFILGVVFCTVIIVVIVDLTVHGSNPYNLVSLSGIVVFVSLLFICSYNPSKVKWRTVGWGFGIQFVFALMILRWPFGYEAFKWLGDRVSEYLAYVNAGSEFLFGPNYADHFFAFQILPTVIFMSATITILFYLGAMQWIIVKIAFVMQACMNTTAGESVNAAGNIFIGQTESPLMIRPLLPDMTDSEIHAVMTGGFATIAGSVMAAYILFGVPANHLLTASVMAAPAALAMSKLSYPELAVSKTSAQDVEKSLKNVAETNFVEAAASGASAAIPLVANIAANLIAFIALLAFFNATLTWFGDRVGAQQPITFQYLCSYVFWPFAFTMGVAFDDCRKVAELVGVKTFINEFVAFDELGKLINNRAKLDSHVALNGTWEWTDHREDITLYPLPGQNTTTILINGVIEVRSAVIATYALCGFANVGAIGMQIGAFSAMVPEKKAVFPKLAVRAMIAGMFANFSTACIAGLFYQAEY